MNKLNQEIIDKIINNCKDEGTYVSQKEDQDFEVWKICFIDKDKEFKHFNIIHFYEYEDSKEYWSIDPEEDSEIMNAYYEAIEGENDEYTLKEFHKEYDYILEINREIIELVIVFEGNILYC